ncbi:MAG: DoxX family membrane protein [candidate division Zixibacteria bacterium]|nr:DoxX family membrane protein [candidate division Zixibacteria bacterium]
MRKLIDSDVLTMISRLLIGAIFVYASFYKIISPGDFAKSIWYYHLFPGVTINLMAIVIPWLELLCGLALIFGVWYRGAVIWVNVLLVAFVIALASTIARNLSIDCGCFKAAESATGSAWNAMTWDFVYLLFSLQMLFSRSRRWQLQKR